MGKTFLLCFFPLHYKHLIFSTNVTQSEYCYLRWIDWTIILEAVGILRNPYIPSKNMGVYPCSTGYQRDQIRNFPNDSPDIITLNANTSSQNKLTHPSLCYNILVYKQALRLIRPPKKERERVVSLPTDNLVSHRSLTWLSFTEYWP